jgi:hypothetical protein
MITELEALSKRIDKIEKQKADEVLTLVEILSNAAFFGEIKKASCEYAKESQCSFFILTSEAKGKIPIVSDCRVNQCSETSLHCHLELSNITCALCEIKHFQPTAPVFGPQFKQKIIGEKRLKRSKKRIQ